MLVTPRLGADRAALLQQLVQVETDLKNVRGRGLTPDGLFYAYLQWVAGAVRMLRYQVREAELESLVLTRRYWTLQAMAGVPIGMARDLVEVEMEDRLTVLEETIRTTRAEFERWNRVGLIVVADTSFYHQHPLRLDVVDLSKVLDSRDEPISLVVPMVVMTSLRSRSVQATRGCAAALK